MEVLTYPSSSVEAREVSRLGTNNTLLDRRVWPAL